MIDEEIRQEIQSAIVGGLPLRVFYSGDEASCYGLGLPLWIDEEWMLMAELELSGQPDGLTLARINTIESISINDIEAKRAKILFEEYFRKGRRTQPVPSPDFSLHEFLRRKTKLRGSVAVQLKSGEWEYGYLIRATKTHIRIVRLDYMGDPDGEQFYLLPAIEQMCFNRRNDVARWRMSKINARPR